MWKYFLTFILITLSGVLTQQSPDNTQPIQQQYFAKIGQFITGRLNNSTNRMTMHHYQLDDTLDMKYLFLRLSSQQILQSPVLSVYDFDKRQLIKSCNLNEFPECYIQKDKFKPSQKIVILVSADNQVKYNLQTYWGNLEHLNIDQNIHFMFDKNTSQLFHLQVKDNEKFEQLRIILKPLTMRAAEDKLKIFLNYGTQSEPTEQKHDIQSIRVWKEAEAIFLTRKDLQKKDGAFLYIVGNSQTIYQLECQAIRQNHHDLQVNQLLEEYLPGQQTYLYHIDGSKLDSVYDQFVFKFSVFYGQIAIKVFEDEKLTKAYKNSPLQYMSDIGLIMDSKQLINDLKNLYIQVYCPDASAIYSLILQGLSAQRASEMQEDVFDFVRFSQEKKALYFKYPIFQSQQNYTPKNNTFVFSFNTIKLTGEYKLKFYVCNVEASQRQKCLNIDREQEFSKSVEQIIPSSMPEIGSKTIYTLQVAEKYFKKTISVSKEVLVLAVFYNKDNTQVIGAMEFSNNNKVKVIRQDKAIQQQVRQGSYRIFKFSSSDPQVQEVQIHYNHISGTSRIKVGRQDPRLAGIAKQQQPGNQSSSVFTIKQDLDKPIYITVFGFKKTIFTLTAAVKHKNHTESSGISLAEDIPYKFKVQAFKSKLIKIHPIQQSVIMKYKSIGGPIYICQTNYYGVCTTNNSLFVNQSAVGTIKINSDNKRTLRFKIANGFNPRQNVMSSQINTERPIQQQIPNRVEVEILYHNELDRHCEIKEIGQIYSQILQMSSCLKFNIPKVDDLYIMTRKQDIGAKFEMFFICASPVQPTYKNNRYFISKKQILNKCGDSKQDINLMILLNDQDESKQMIRYQYAVEYLNKGIVLQDGVSYTVRDFTISNDIPIKTFYYQIIDPSKSTQIILFNHKGIQKFFGTIVSNKTKIDTTATQSFSSIKSSDSQYFLNPEITVTPEDIKNSGCSKNCYLIVSVYTQQKIGEQLEFTMEITSSSVVLGEDQIHQDFLGQGSYQYYHYQMRQLGKSLYIKLSDSNIHCAKLYISNKQYPSSSNYLKQDNSGEITVQDTDQSTYYIGVQAERDCSYTISASESNAKITKMQYGQFYDVQMKQGEIKIFLVKHYSENSFKLLSMQKHGHLTFYANQTELDKGLFEKIEKQEIQYENFKFISKYRNTLFIDHQNDGFCNNCTYLIVVKAQKNTHSSIVLVGENAKIGLQPDKILFDQINSEKTGTIATFYEISDGTLFAKVHSGKIKVQMTYGGNKQQFTFSKNKKVHQQSYKFQNNNSFEPIKINITALQVPALYSIHLQPLQNQTVATRMTPGQHSYLYLNDGTQSCISGYLRDKNQLIYLTVNAQDDLKLKRLNVRGSINGKPKQHLKISTIGNIMTLTFVFDSVFFKDALEYEVCMGFNQTEYSMSIVAFQNQNVNILPANTEAIVRKSNKFVLHPNGDLLIDIFSCKGQPNIRYATRQQKLKQDNSHDLDKIAIPGQSHAIKIEEYQTIFLEVTANQATVSWMPLDSQKQQGVGYFKYSVGNVQYQTSFNKIIFKIGGISQIKETSTQVQLIKYSIYIADSNQHLDQAVMCSRFGQNVNKFISTYQSHGSKLVNQTVQVPIQKNRISSAFQENSTLFFNVVADMKLKAPSIRQGDPPTFENYKFIYFSQEVPSDVFKQNIIEATNLNGITVLIIVGVVGFLIVAWVFIKIIIPTIGRIRNRMLVQENNQKDKSIPIPPSSQRNQVKQMQLQNPPQTDERLQ